MSVKFFKTQLKAIQGLGIVETLESERKAQERLGSVMQRIPKNAPHFEPLQFPLFTAAVAFPQQQDCSGAVLYLHGGGYCSGGQEYAKGFGAILSAAAGVRVYCPAYRLAPEQPFPAALDDAMTIYRYVLERFPAQKLVLAGESAGGGLCYALCLKLRELSLPLPGGILACSAWTDLTASGLSYRENTTSDPSITGERLHRYAQRYAGAELTNPLVSPLLAELHGMPESLLFVGGDEIMRDDTVLLHGKLLAADCRSELTVAPELWHGYVLYQLKQRRQDMDTIAAFIGRIAK